MMRANYISKNSELLEDWFTELSIVCGVLDKSINNIMGDGGCVEHADLLHILMYRLNELMEKNPIVEIREALTESK